MTNNNDGTTIISIWTPEDRLIIHQVLGKLAEEASEAANIAIRCMIQGLDEVEPVTRVSNIEALTKEISDVTATIRWLEEVTGIKPRETRIENKLAGYREWAEGLQQLLDDAQERFNIDLLRM
ncbi:hypothetical protein EVB91_221 [Rhizobium phage RHph_I1_18]|nr:hypothetical protein EVB91_221 [Rhizobium phage RHph_I1_18]